jgi:soluble lytic murein transglycosylase-like protein
LIDGRRLAVAVIALVGPVVCGPFLGASPAWAGAEHRPSSPTRAPSAWSSVDRAVPPALLAPVTPAGLVAPSYAGWLVDPREARPGGKFVARGQVLTEAEMFQRVIAVPPSAPLAFTSDSSTSTPSVPLPPKRLAEKRRIVMASLAPLPPPRLAEPPPIAAQEAVPEETAADPASSPADDAADQNADASPEDAAKPIDDGPEPVPTRLTANRAPPHIEALIERYARRFDVPAALLRRVAWRESNFDPRKRNGPYWGLMQIRVDTARGLGFRGAPRDLLEANTNMAFAAAYLANAYRVAGRDEKRAVMLYSRGYYYEAKRKRMLDSLIRTAAAEE